MPLGLLLLLAAQTLPASTQSAVVCSIKPSDLAAELGEETKGFNLIVQGGFSQTSRPFRLSLASVGDAYEQVLGTDCKWHRRKLDVNANDRREINRLLATAAAKPLKPRYMAAFTDGQVIELNFRVNGEERSVLDYGGAYAGLPHELVLVESIANSLRQR